MSRSVARPIARIAAIDADRRDVLLALALLAGLEAEVAVTLNGADLAAAAIGSVVIAVAVALRRRWVGAAPVAVAAVTVPVAITGAETRTGPFPALILLIFSLALHFEGRRMWAAAGLYVALMLTAVALTTTTHDAPGDVAWSTAFLLGFPFAAGRALRIRTRLAAQLERRAAELERERAETESAAVTGERERIARELHDVVAHSVSVMVIQAAAARRLVEARPGDAHAAIAAIEGTGREALGEMRRLLGVLRREDAELALAPQPGLRRLDDLAQRSTASGLPVSVHVEGEALPLPPGLDVAAFRVVQEALAAALAADGGGRADVTVRYGRHDLELEIAHRGRPSAPDPDLAAIVERIRLFGGELHAGRRRGGAFGVRVQLPMSEVAA